MARISLAALSALDRAAFTARLGAVYEHSPWVAEQAWEARPFASIEALQAAMAAAVEAAGPEAGVALLGLHPELAAPGALTAASAGEQARAGLTTLDDAARERFAADNRRYRERFGFPFIVAVRGQRDPAAIAQALARRLAGTAEAERATALGEVGKIARFRLEDLVEPAPATGEAQDFLTVHALDLATGTPAAGLAFTLARDGLMVSAHVTNADGRCAAPLLAGAALCPGTYEIVFDVQGWRAGADDPGFYDRIAIRFVVNAACGHIHIPLLLSPYGYSTYRGS